MFVYEKVKSTEIHSTLSRFLWITENYLWEKFSPNIQFIILNELASRRRKKTKFDKNNLLWTQMEDRLSAILNIYFISLAYFKDNASFALRHWSKMLLQEIENINFFATEFSLFSLLSQLRLIVAFGTCSALNQNIFLLKFKQTPKKANCVQKHLTYEQGRGWNDLDSIKKQIYQVWARLAGNKFIDIVVYLTKSTRHHENKWFTQTNLRFTVFQDFFDSLENGTKRASSVCESTTRDTRTSVI